MLACPLCKTTNKNHFSSYIVDLNPNKLTNDTITARVQCLYCNDDFVVESDINWKLKDTVKEPNPKYKLTASVWYESPLIHEDDIYLPKGEIVELQGFYLSKHSRFSPFKTKYNHTIRLSNNIVSKI